MPSTIQNFRLAINMPSIFFKNLIDVKATHTINGQAAISCSKYFANTFIEWCDKEYLLSLPLSDEAVRRAQHASAKLFSRKSKLLLKYKLMPFEMNYTNAQGNTHASDIVLQEIPKDGKILYDCISSLKAESLFAAIESMRLELSRLKLRLNNLSAHSVMVDENYDLFPIELHEVTVGEPADNEFYALKEFVAAHFDVTLPKAPHEDIKSYESPKQIVKGYDYVGNPFEGVRVVKNSDGYGYIDTENNEIIAPQYIWAGDIREGRAEVETAQGMGLINAAGEYIIEPVYQIVDYDIKTGRSRVKQNDEWFYMDYEGRRITNPETQERQLFEKVTY